MARQPVALAVAVLAALGLAAAWWAAQHSRPSRPREGAAIEAARPPARRGHGIAAPVVLSPEAIAARLRDGGRASVVALDAGVAAAEAAEAVAPTVPATPAPPRPAPVEVVPERPAIRLDHPPTPEEQLEHAGRLHDLVILRRDEVRRRLAAAEAAGSPEVNRLRRELSRLDAAEPGAARTVEGLARQVHPRPAPEAPTAPEVEAVPPDGDATDAP